MNLLTYEPSDLGLPIGCNRWTVVIGFQRRVYVHALLAFRNEWYAASCDHILVVSNITLTVTYNHPICAHFSGRQRTLGPNDDILVTKMHINDVNVKGKCVFYIAQYPVRWTVQSALHFSSPAGRLFKDNLRPTIMAFFA